MAPFSDVKNMETENFILRGRLLLGEKDPSILASRPVLSLDDSAFRPHLITPVYSFQRPVETLRVNSSNPAACRPAWRVEVF
jgi:hypothetical protein